MTNKIGERLNGRKPEKSPQNKTNANTGSVFGDSEMRDAATRQAFSNIRTTLLISEVPRWTGELQRKVTG